VRTSFIRTYRLRLHYAYTYIQDRNCLASPASFPDPPVDAPLPATLVLCRAPPLFLRRIYLPRSLARRCFASVIIKHAALLFSAFVSLYLQTEKKKLFKKKKQRGKNLRLPFFFVREMMLVKRRSQSASAAEPSMIRTARRCQGGKIGFR
jgi:hypothetical protein